MTKAKTRPARGRGHPPEPKQRRRPTPTRPPESPDPAEATVPAVTGARRGGRRTEAGATTPTRPPESPDPARATGAIVPSGGGPRVPGTDVEILPQLVPLLVPIERVRPDPANPRIVRDLDMVVNSMRRFGVRWPLVVNSRTEVVEAGHQRLGALAALGATAVPVLWADDDGLTAQAFNIADNRVGELAATWDTVALDRLLAGMRVDASASLTPIDTEALLRDIGLPGGDLSALLAPGGGLAPPPAPPAQHKGKRVAPVPPAMLRAPVSRQGDRWILGHHRLACGDCRDAALVAWTLADQPCGVVLTDPPYCSGGFQEAGKRAGTWGQIASDTLSSRGYAALMRDWISAAHPQVAYIFTDWRMWTTLFDVVEDSGLPVRGMLVWNKGTPGLGALWRTQHELILYSARGGNRRDEIKHKAAHGNVLTCQRSGNVHHYTEKPVELLAEILDGDAASGRSGVVFDPFAGSGSTLIACDLLGRPCAAVEVEPKYVDLICRRWAEQTGAAAVLEATRRTWLETAADRGVDVSDLAPPEPPGIDPHEAEEGEP